MEFETPATFSARRHGEKGEINQHTQEEDALSHQSTGNVTAEQHAFFMQLTTTT